MTKYVLTEEHRAQFPAWRDRWVGHAMRTRPMDSDDRAKMAEAIEGLYRAAGKEPPPRNRIVFVSSPIVANFVAGFAAGIWHLRAGGRDADDCGTDDVVHSETYAATRAATTATIEEAKAAADIDPLSHRRRPRAHHAIKFVGDDSLKLEAHFLIRHAGSEKTNDATVDAADDATRARVTAAVWVAVNDATHYPSDYWIRNAIRCSTYDNSSIMTMSQTRIAKSNDLSKWFVVSEDMTACAQRFGREDGREEFLLRCAFEAWRLGQGGSLEAPGSAYLSFFRHIAKLPLDYSKWQHWETANIHGSFRYMHNKFCIVSDFPVTLKVDSQNRAHCDDGPYCEWSNGDRLYLIHGVPVPAWFVEHKDQITVAKIDAESNAEARRVMVEIYGADRYCQDKGAVCIHEEPGRGRLWRTERNGDPILMVELFDSTPQRDGTIKHYWERVHPELVPYAPSRGFLGLPEHDGGQELTVTNAIASRYGMLGHEYRPSQET